jgi:hypothetical protein
MSASSDGALRSEKTAGDEGGGVVWESRYGFAGNSFKSVAEGCESDETGCRCLRCRLVKIHHIAIAASITTTAMIPITMPAIAPPDRDEDG